MELLKAIVDDKAGEWKGTAMERYLRPDTLFGPKTIDRYAGPAQKLLDTRQLSRYDDDHERWRGAFIKEHGRPPTWREEQDAKREKPTG